MAPKPQVPTQTTKGKTGDDLETATISQQAEQADYKDSALPTGTEIDLQDQSVQDNELLSSDAVRLGETPQIDAAEKVVTTEQQTPEEYEASTYTAQTTADNIGEAEAAVGEVSQDALVTAEQGTVSQDALATAATAELNQRATTQYQLGQLMQSVTAGGPLPPWASPAVRRVNAIMQQRGLGSSSMAAAAITQASWSLAYRLRNKMQKIRYNTATKP